MQEGAQVCSDPITTGGMQALQLPGTSQEGCQGGVVALVVVNPLHAGGLAEQAFDGVATHLAHKQALSAVNFSQGGVRSLLGGPCFGLGEPVSCALLLRGQVAAARDRGGGLGALGAAGAGLIRQVCEELPLCSCRACSRFLGTE